MTTTRRHRQDPHLGDATLVRPVTALLDPGHARSGGGGDGRETIPRSRTRPGHRLGQGRPIVRPGRPWVSRVGTPRRSAPPHLTVPTEGAKKCADTTTVDSSQRSHEAAQKQVHRETRRLRNSLDGGGRHDVGTHHGVRQLIPQRGPTTRSGPSPRQPPAPHPRPGSPACGVPEVGPGPVTCVDRRSRA